MTGAWNHALGRATILVERLARLRLLRAGLALMVPDAERTCAAEEARLTLSIWSDPDIKNEGARKATLALAQASDHEYIVASMAEEASRAGLAKCDADIAADHDRLSLGKRELDWLIATAGQQREESIIAPGGTRHTWHPATSGG